MDEIIYSSLRILKFLQLRGKGIIGVKWTGIRTMEEVFCLEKCRCLILNIRYLKYVGSSYDMPERYFFFVSRGLSLNLAKYASALIDSYIHTPENP